MKKFYNLGEVIQVMEHGEVAIKVDGVDMRVDENSIFVKIGDGFFFDENDNGILKSLRTGKPITICKLNGVEPFKYVIMSREAYNKIKNKQ